jgi:drug/metabolite transporter (DMT)-like permease
VTARSTPAWQSLVPAFFVFLWSSGFITAKFGLPYAPPLTFLIMRYTGAVLVLAALAFAARVPWPRQVGHLAVAGVLLQAGYTGALWVSIRFGMPAGMAALIVGMQPLLTALAAPLIGERVHGRQWLGLLLGLGGVALVVAAKINLSGLSPVSIGLAVFALFSITIGTLYQKRFCPSFDLRTGTLVQYGAALAVLAPFAVAYEGLDPAFSAVHWNFAFAGALAWAVLGLSLGAVSLLFWLISRNNATQVTSLLYLTPPTTAIMAWLMFGEALSPAGLLGMALAVTGVAFVVKK